MHGDASQASLDIGDHWTGILQAVREQKDRSRICARCRELPARSIQTPSNRRTPTGSQASHQAARKRRGADQRLLGGIRDGGYGEIQIRACTERNQAVAISSTGFHQLHKQGSSVPSRLDLCPARAVVHRHTARAVNNQHHVACDGWRRRGYEIRNDVWRGTPG